MDKDFFYFKDIIEFIENTLGKTEWVTVFSISPLFKDTDGGFHPALISNNIITDVLNKYEGDLEKDGGLPGFVGYYENGIEIVKYYRYADERIEPLVYWRSFHGARNDYFEISEEFRLFFNLYEDRKKNVFIYFDENGDEEEVIRILNGKIDIKLRFLKEFISAKKMYLAIYFDFMRFSNTPITDLGIEEIDKVVKKENLRYSLLVRPINIGGKHTQSWIMGKKLISGIKNYNPSIFNRNKDEKYEDFIIGVDEDGKNILYTCDEEKLANYFGKNPDAPHYLTPVYFKKEVLKKYYDTPSKYFVGDGYIHCKGFWKLRIDNNHPDCIMVFLGDLGKLNHKEQIYWKSFNISYAGGISHVAWKRGFEAKFTDPEEPCLYFKYKFDQFQKNWFKKFNWYLFKPLSDDDQHHYKSLHIPTTNDRKEFDDQILSLTKLIIDSLNESKLIENIKIDKPNAKGIDKFEAFLFSQGVESPQMIKYLRNLQTLRSTSVAHRKSSKNRDYHKALQYFEFEKYELIKVFENILIKAIRTLNTLENYFLSYS